MNLPATIVTFSVSDKETGRHTPVSLFTRMTLSYILSDFQSQISILRLETLH